MGAEKMGTLHVALGLTRNKLDLVRDGKGALGKTFRQRFEAEGQPGRGCSSSPA